MGVPERKRREFERREAEILAAALAFFDGDEWESVTVEQIAARAEIGKGTVYKHFASKHEIYARLALDFYLETLRALRSVDVHGSPDVVLRAVIREAFQFHLARPEYRRLTQYCARDDFRKRLGDELRSEFDQLDRDFMSFMEGLLREGIETGVFPERPVERLTWPLHATFDGALAYLWAGKHVCGAGWSTRDTDIDGASRDIGVSAVTDDATENTADNLADNLAENLVGDGAEAFIEDVCDFMIAGLMFQRR